MHELLLQGQTFSGNVRVISQASLKVFGHILVLLIRLDFSLEVKRTGREANRSSSSSAVFLSLFES